MRNPVQLRGSIGYLNDMSNGWSPSNQYLLPKGVYFVGPVPALEGGWLCPEGTKLTSVSEHSFAAAVESDLGTQIIDVNGDAPPDIGNATNYRYP